MGRVPSALWGISDLVTNSRINFFLLFPFSLSVLPRWNRINRYSLFGASVSYLSLRWLYGSLLPMSVP